MSKVPTKPWMIRLPVPVYEFLREVAFHGGINMKAIVMDILMEQLPVWMREHFDIDGNYFPYPKVKQENVVQTKLDQSRQDELVAKIKEASVDFTDLLSYTAPGDDHD